MAPELIHVLSQPRPFSHERAAVVMPAGDTLGELLDEIDWPLRFDKYTRIYVDGIEILRPDWDTRRTRESERVVVAVVPAGDKGGKSILAAVAMIVLVIAAPYIAGPILGFTGVTAQVVAAGITIAGSMLISALIKPPSPANLQDSGRAASQMYSLGGQSNQATPYGMIGRIYGRLKVFPKLAAIPYTVNLQGGNYLHALYDFGYGPLQIEDIRIGSTSISLYQGVTYNLHQSFVAGDPLTLYASDSFGEGFNIALNRSPDTGARATQNNTVQVVVDLLFPTGLFLQHDNGEISGNSAVFKITVDGDIDETTHFITAGCSRGGPGINLAYTTNQILITSDPSRDPFAYSIWMRMPAAGLYTITIVRMDSQTLPQAQYGYKSTWSQLRSIGAKPALQTQAPHTVLELRVRANDQLSGTIDTLSAICTSILPVWDGATWTDQPTRNPAWVFYNILTGTASNRPVDAESIDLPALLDWANECDTEMANDPGVGRYRCDVMFDWKATVREALQTVAACGRAALNMRDARFSVIRESGLSLPVQVITKRNSWELSASMPYLDIAHGLNVKFLDEETWTQEQVQVFVDGYDEETATLFEDLELVGVVRRNQAWRFGRYHLAQAILRRERATVNMDIENLVAQRGDIVAVAHDILKVGGFPARVVQITGNDVRVDAPFETASISAIRVRQTDVRGLSDIIAVSAVLDAVTLTVADVSGISVGDLLVYGTTEVTVGDYVVDAVRPGRDLSASIDLLEHRPEILDADTGPIPLRVPKPGLNPDNTLTSPAPLLLQTLYLIHDYARVYDITLTWTRSPLATVYRVLTLEGGQWREIGTTKDTRYIYDIPAAAVADHTVILGVQAYSALGVASEIAQASLTVDPATDPWPPPPPPYELTAVPFDVGIEVRWKAYPYDFADFYAVRLGTSWDDFTDEWTSKTLVLNLPPQLSGTHTVWVRTIDGAGQESLTATGPVTFTVLDPLQVTIVGNAVANTAYLRWGSLALGALGWTAQTTHKIEYYEIAKTRTVPEAAMMMARGFAAAPAGPPPAPRRTPLQFILSNAAGSLGGAPKYASVGALAGPLDESVYEPVGRSSTEFAVLSEQVEGQWTYAVRPVDVAGNYGPWNTVSLLLTPPDNYFLLDHLDDLLPTSTLTNSLGFNDGTGMTSLDPAAPKQLLPFDTTQTWEGHFILDTWPSPQDQVDDGYPRYAQPGIADGIVEWIHDYVDAIPQVRLTVKPYYIVLTGTPTVDGEVYTKLDAGDPWALAFTGLQGIVPQNARYIRVLIVFSPGADRAGQVLLDSVDYSLDVHFFTDQGVDAVHAADATGTFVPFQIEFVHVVGVQLTPASAGVAYCQFTIEGDPPTGLRLYAFDITGVRVDGSVSWSARGY